MVANQPAAFTLLSSAERSERLDELVTFGKGDDVHRHAPLVTALRYGQRSRRVPLKVRLNVIFTEIGTLELWCESIATEHRWRLQFNLRAAESADGLMQAPPDDDSAGRSGRHRRRSGRGGRAAARGTRFSTPAGGSRVDALLGELENLLGHGKHAWPLPVIRRLADVLLQGADGRRLSARHEARWLNLVGFCMRPVSARRSTHGALPNCARST